MQDSAHKKMNKTEIGRHIKEMRMHLGITQKDLAEISEVSLRSLVDIEAGKANPGFDQLQRIVETLGMEILIKVKKYE
ncbi:MAG: helix-turn-helix domain-containing protein [Bacteroidetes bacterium]|nr:helix-turn-helix domain-containing protein [Bacteroidota bacterium]